jgi:biotin transport system substrate-specific component
MKKITEIFTIQNIVLITLFAALTSVGSYIAIPIGPVPIVLQNLFVLLAALLLGPWRALAVVVVFLLAGIVGLPVFSGGKGGIVHLLGPTGGYLVSYIPAALVTGFISHAGKRKIWKNLLGSVIASIVVYAIGVPWLKYTTGMEWQTAIAVGVLPFIIGDLLKVTAATSLARIGEPILALTTHRQ